MPRVIGTSSRVVAVEGVFSIDEIVGNVATKEDTLSVARVLVEKASSEPWLTLNYDEWMCVIKGKVELHYMQDGEQLQVLTVEAGETAFIDKGERFRPVFPVDNAEYIAICLPAFQPDRCIREEEGVEHEKTSERLKSLHSKSPDNPKDIIFHMCEKSRWNEAILNRKAYFPPTYENDGGFTHATSKAYMLLDIANHYYLDSKEEWICISLSQSALEGVGIVTKTEEAKPVGDTEVIDADAQFPHIFGGIPAHIPGIVAKEYPIKRDTDGKFLSIEGL
mmetsp:Transcript_15759/g.20562  ORF Transcript_15759/g.20562 Transcript_15759/m.20562 type:complete len:278 (-) Transcript_15759:405-1238(-)|eukprot:CAMPEP_0198149068 /NCGR_PEP_ID=MMETSP1443-20131203/44892_1 /TAXON_ID=186043 /ORGANISM="Entomoneis sp., Strain CCMP2396" /LENGTH=277 /DNA_ID=CAMNT_0043813985 /DNA_START=82 /DNA_END=915 /DNA_ORIENTATION=+